MARKIIGSLFTSLDGVIQAPGGPTEDYTGGFEEGGWVFKVADDGINETLGALFGNPFELLLGRRTYDIFAAYWPYVEGEEAGMGGLFTGVNKYVLTSTTRDLEWANTHTVSGMDELAKLKASDGPDLLIQGSGTLYPQLLQRGLLDELTLLTYPIVLGAGKRWFGNANPALMLDAIDSRVTGRGTVITTYRPLGDLPPYPVDGPKPSNSDREAERQEAMKSGSW